MEEVDGGKPRVDTVPKSATVGAAPAVVAPPVMGSPGTDDAAPAHDIMNFVRGSKRERDDDEGDGLKVHRG